MNNEYIDIDSSYRNRNLWPLPGQFEIPIAQTGIKGKGYALDPVCLSEPIAVWSCNGLSTSQNSTFQLSGIISPPQIYGNSGYNQDDTSLTIVFTDPYNNTVQTIENYYVGLIFWNVTNTTFSRITSYKYIGNDGTVPSTRSFALITIATAFDFKFGDSFCITDTSDLTKPEYPLLFVPNGKIQDDAYLNYILYCESNNDYRPITFYTSLDKYVSSEPWEGINNPVFQQYGNFCIRKEPPSFPLKLEASQFVSTTSTNSIIKINISGTCSLTKKTDEYKYDFLRIRPYRKTDESPSIIAGGDSNVSSNPVLAYSTNGLEWDKVLSSSNFVIYSITNDGADNVTWLASGDTGSTNLIYSTGGKIWQSVPTNPFALRTIYSVFYLGNYWFVGTISTVSGQSTFGISTDLTNWTDKYNPFGNPFSSIGSNLGIGGICIGILALKDEIISTKINIYLAGGNQTTGSISTVIIGNFDTSLTPPASRIIWAQSSVNPFISGFAQAIKTNGDYFIVVGNNSLRTICISISFDKCNTWTPSNNNPFTGGACYNVEWNGVYWVAVGYNFPSLSISIAISYNGFDWTPSVNSPFTLGIGLSIIWTGSYWVAGGMPYYSVPNSPVIASSPDGLNWTVTGYSDDFFSVYALSVYNTFNFANLGIYSKNLKSQSRQITSYMNDGVTATFEVYPPFDGDNLFSVAESYTIEVEPFSYDNFNPFSYNGTLIQQASCYEIELIELILPNFTLSSGSGGKIAFYPYIYVELSNVSSSGGRLTNIIHSNNPNATKMIFKVPIYDIQDPVTTPYVRLVSSYMIQSIKFKPNDNLFVKVILPNGDIFNTLLPETYSPEIPNSDNQTSFKFRIKNL